MYSVILKLAWNNAFLRLRRTLLVIIMIAVSMSMMLSIEGIYDGMVINMVDKTIRSDSGDISIYNPKYRLNKLLQNSIKGADEIKAALETRQDVESVVTRFSVEGLSSTAHKSSFSSIIGIDLDDEERFGAFSDFLKEGEISFGKRGALIGSELAKTLKIRIGSKVVFTTQDSSGDINAIAVRIRGIVQTTNIVLDATALYIDNKRLHTFLGVGEDEATQIAIRTKSETLQQELQKRYKRLDVLSLMDLNPMLKMMEDMMVIFNSITFGIVMMVVFIGILGVMYVSILDRIREFGIMRGIGMPFRLIRLQILLEALFVGLLGYLTGAVLGVAALLYLQYFGLDMSAWADGLESFGYESIIYAHMQISYFTNTFLAIIAASLLSVLLPLRKIKTLNPIEVIKAET
ncbi:FtsX-like permease family protein [Sulfurimonas sp. HSL3-7]|uniref:ABC transporter permease n=1 Tax=Sulfonitrofixus jiaomeiensis TaxID=3131938 RepID=UPI0031F809F2